MCSPNTNRPRWKQGITKIINNKKWNPAHPPYPHCLLPQQTVRTTVVNDFQHARKRGNNVLCCEQLACTVDERCVKTHPPKKELANAYCAGVYINQGLSIPNSTCINLETFHPYTTPQSLKNFQNPLFKFKLLSQLLTPLLSMGVAHKHFF